MDTFPLRIAFRNLWKYKGFSLINIAGLAIGLAVLILISLFVIHETTYDSFHRNLDHIYEVNTVYHDASHSEHTANTPLPMPTVLKNHLGNAITISSIWQYTYPGVQFHYRNISLADFNGYSVDEGFLGMFSFPSLSGDLSRALVPSHSAVFTRSAAIKLFGKQDAVGEVFKVDSSYYTVTGILDDLPTNSTLRFDVLFSPDTRYRFYPNFDTRWWETGLTTYLLLMDSSQLSQVRNTLTYIHQNELFKEFRDFYSFELRPLKGIHLDSSVTGQEVTAVGSAYLSLLIGIAMAVILIACLNYTILSLSIAEMRYRASSVSKVFGATVKNILGQYILEALIMSIVAVYIAVLLARLFFPMFARLTGKSLDLHLGDYRVLAGALLLAILIGAVTALYPGLVLSRFNVVGAQRKRTRTTAGGWSMKKTLLVIQLTIASSLLISEFTILHQLQFMKHHDIGYNPDNLLSVPVIFLDGNHQKRLEKTQLFAQEIERKSAALGFSKATITENIPGFYYQNQFKLSTLDKDAPEFAMVITSVDENFNEVFGVQVKEGSGFIPGKNTAYGHIMLNETAMRTLGLKHPGDKPLRFHFDATPLEVIGVVKDINTNSLQHPIEPLVYQYGSNNYPGFLTIRIAMGKYRETREYLEQTWQKLFGEEIPFDCFFVFDKYNEKYGTEALFSGMIGTFSLVAILLSLVGLLALVTFMTAARTKEIGIRKCNGATSLDILRLLGRELLTWVIAGFVLACPLAWYAMQKWMQQFAYRTGLSWWIFALGGLTILIVALGSAGYLVLRTARSNPVDSLRYE